MSNGNRRKFVIEYLSVNGETTTKCVREFSATNRAHALRILKQLVENEIALAESVVAEESIGDFAL